MTVHSRGVKPPLEQDPEALKIAPKAPEYLTPLAKVEWRTVMKLLIPRRILTKADLGGIECYCVQIALVRECEAERAENGGKIDPKLFSVMNRASQTALRLAAEYGLSPTSRARLGAVPKQDDDSDNPLKV